MNSDHSIKNTHSKIVLDYSFCNSSNLWNYLGIITIILFLITLMSYLKHRQHQKTVRHHKNNYNTIYIIVLILLGLFFVVPFMCWLLTFVEILVTFIRYGQIAASPLPILSLPIRIIAYIYMKITIAIHMYLTAPGTFIFLLFFITFTCIKFVILLVLRFGVPGFLVCSWIGFAIPLYALSEVGNIDSWVDLLFNSQLPLFILLKFSPLLLAVQSRILWIFLFILFLFGCYLKFGLTLLFVCKCLLIIVLVRFTYVIGKAFIIFVFFTPVAANTSRNSDDIQ
ncbi:unnamed protein product [Adineta steineri]|uniref:Uncharacterized protein n=1 Tax=Adineta steineri TaxID=433720 RepID=A0A815GP52_9BILA|nr:unnamed protein product [Adineta steineri]CAF1343807.1 unnamed protein product [Adineta steineri]CAF1411646.1 unnamed protein product [Adineta steineri]CAF1459193.1 unnamed protein product [Adineta steineri]CAF1592832.1 unnamed protein product [Adineta steineri]